MFGKLLTVITAAVVALGVSTTASASGEVAEPATLIVYRADESVRTKRLGMDVFVGQASVGRLKAENAIVITRAAGEYTLDASIEGTESVLIDLKPGQSHYVHVEVAMSGARAKVELVEVEEQIARTQQPSLGEAI
jgi:hypothetical protein